MTFTAEQRRDQDGDSCVVHGCECSVAGVVAVKVLFPVGVGLWMVGYVHLSLLADTGI